VILQESEQKNKLWYFDTQWRWKNK